VPSYPAGITVSNHALITVSRAGARDGPAPVHPLASIAAVPFGLWLLRAVYGTPGADPAGVLDSRRFPDTATLRAHLLDQLIPALIDIGPPGKGPGDLVRVDLASLDHHVPSRGPPALAAEQHPEERRRTPLAGSAGDPPQHHRKVRQSRSSYRPRFRCGARRSTGESCRH
jgi:hypothetical protein